MSRKRLSLTMGLFGGLLLAAVGFGLGVTAMNNDGDAPLAALTPAAAYAAPAGELRSYADVAAAAMPGVVNISTDKVTEMPTNHPFLNDPSMRRFFGIPEGETNERIERSLGSGVIVSADGYILTSNHVITKATKIRVTLNGSEEFEAEIIGQDELTDVALIKIDPDETLPHVMVGDSENLRIGDQVMAIGNPFGVGQTVTMGIVSAMGRSIGMMAYEDFIQTDASINPGNSGGALINMQGELIGINTAIMSRNGGSQGVGFAISSNMASRIMDMLIEDGRVRRAWLGVITAEVDQTMAEALEMDRPRGVLMSEVNDGTPADEAGIREGDIVLEVDGEQVNSISELRNTISLAGVGHKAEMLVLRDGRERDITVELGELPDNLQASAGEVEERESEGGLEGVRVKKLDQRTRDQLGVDEDVEGVVIVNVSRSSNAWNRGLREGDVITEIWRERVESIDDYEDLVDRNDDRPVLLKIMRGTTAQLLAIPR